LAARPLFLGQPTATPVFPPAWPADVRSLCPPSLPCGATVSAVFYLLPGWEGAFLLLAAAGNQASDPPIPSFWTRIPSPCHPIKQATPSTCSNCNSLHLFELVVDPETLAHCQLRFPPSDASPKKLTRRRSSSRGTEAPRTVCLPLEPLNDSLGDAIFTRPSSSIPLCLFLQCR
jgi:hypothetical protein